MARTYKQPGDVLPLTAPTGGVTAGTPVLIGGLLVVPQNTAAEGEPFEGMRTGVHTLPKTSAQAWTQLAKVYWDNTNKVCTTTATSNTLIGVAAAPAANPSATGDVVLAGVPYDAAG